MHVIVAAKDMHSGKMLKVGEAKVMNILDIEKGAFQNLQTKKWMLIGDAVDLGLVEIDYDMDAAGNIYLWGKPLATSRAIG